MRRLAKVPPKVLLGIAWLWIVIYAYPGQLTQDSVDHLTEVRAHVYTDAHPPMINLIWRILDTFVSGPFLMLALQVALLVIGLYFVFRRTMSERAAAWATLGMMLFPPVMIPMGVIWKDPLMAGGLMLGVAAFSSERRNVRLWGLVAVFLATAVRYNALAATLPIVVMCFVWKPNLTAWKRYGIAVVAWLCVTFAAFTVNARLTNVPMYYWHSSLAVYDIAGTIVHMSPPPNDAEVEKMLEGTGLQVHQGIYVKMTEVYSSRNFVNLIAETPDRLWVLPVGGTEPPPKAQRDAIEGAWKRVVSNNVGAYLGHRFDVMQQVLGISKSRVGNMVVKRVLPWPEHYVPALGLSNNTSKFQEGLTAVLTWSSENTPLFSPWLYLLLTLLLIPLAWRQRELLALLVSGLALDASLFVLAPSADYRYSHWMIVAVATVVVRLAHQRYSMRVAATTKHSDSLQASAQ